MDDKSQPQNVADPEISKLCFEYFKHFTTITTAAALVELGLYEHLALYTESAIWGVSTLGLTLCLCVIGLVRLSIGTAIKGKFLPIGWLLKSLMVSTASLFLLGVMVFVLAALNPGLNHVLYETSKSIAQNIR